MNPAPAYRFIRSGLIPSDEKRMTLDASGLTGFAASAESMGGSSGSTRTGIRSIRQNVDLTRRLIDTHPSFHTPQSRGRHHGWHRGPGATHGVSAHNNLPGSTPP